MRFTARILAGVKSSETRHRTRCRLVQGCQKGKHVKKQFARESSASAVAVGLRFFPNQDVFQPFSLRISAIEPQLFGMIVL